MRRSRGFSLIELLIVVAIILIIAAIAIPNLLRARMAANEAASISTLRNINSSQVVYYSEFPTTGFAVTLVSLGPASPCSVTGACLIDEIVGCASEPCVKGGYEYYITSDTSGVFPHTTYATTATPTRFGQSGSRNVCSTEDGILRQEVTPTTTLGAGLDHATCGNGALYKAISQ
jgi:prepilin-type N-terminal cleavage/methylation domain-containing protein